MRRFHGLRFCSAWSVILVTFLCIEFEVFSEDYLPRISLNGKSGKVVFL